MGLRACAIKKYVVEYDDVCGFNYGMDALASIIGAFCSDFYCGGDEFHDPGAIWEIARREFYDMIGTISKMDDAEFNLMAEEWKDGCVDDDCLTKEYVVKMFIAYFNATPEDSAYVRIAWL